jgi:hypothetical protein
MVQKPKDDRSRDMQLSCSLNEAITIKNESEYAYNIVTSVSCINRGPSSAAREAIDAKIFWIGFISESSFQLGSTGVFNYKVS